MRPLANHSLDRFVDMPPIGEHLGQRRPRQQPPPVARELLAHRVVVRVEQHLVVLVERPIRRIALEQKRFEKPTRVGQVPARGAGRRASTGCSSPQAMSVSHSVRGERADRRRSDAARSPAAACWRRGVLRLATLHSRLTPCRRSVAGRRARAALGQLERQLAARSPGTRRARRPA